MAVRWDMENNLYPRAFNWTPLDAIRHGLWHSVRKNNLGRHSFQPDVKAATTANIWKGQESSSFIFYTICSRDQTDFQHGQVAPQFYALIATNSQKTMVTRPWLQLSMFFLHYYCDQERISTQNIYPFESYGILLLLSAWH